MPSQVMASLNPTRNLREERFLKGSSNTTHGDHTESSETELHLIRNPVHEFNLLNTAEQERAERKEPERKRGLAGCERSVILRKGSELAAHTAALLGPQIHSNPHWPSLP